MVEERVHEIVWLLGWVTVLAVDEILPDDLSELWIFEKAAAQAVERGREPRDRCRQQDAARSKNATRFTQRLEAVSPVRQMIEWPKQHHGIRPPRIPG